MKNIELASNAIISHVRSLGDKKYRKQYGEFVCEGLRNVTDTLKSGLNVKFVLVSEDFDGEIAEDVCVYSTKRSIFDKLSDVKNSQGILAVLPTIAPRPLTDRVIYLNKVRDPGNVGTILRTAYAANYSVVLDNCADVYSPKVVRSCMSALAGVHLSFDSTVDSLKNDGYTIICADADGESVFDFTSSVKKYCLIIGNEANGIDHDLVQKADKVLSVPISNIESLNAAVAAGIMMFNLKNKIK